MSEDYLVVNCPRCGSTLRFPGNAVRSNLILCPVCLEGEIECVSVQDEFNNREIIENIRADEICCAVPLKVSVN